MSDEEPILARVKAAVSPFSTIDEDDHAARVVDVVERARLARLRLYLKRQIRGDGLSPVPEKEESP